MPAVASLSVVVADVVATSVMLLGVSSPQVSVRWIVYPVQVVSRLVLTRASTSAGKLIIIGDAIWLEQL